MLRWGFLVVVFGGFFWCVLFLFLKFSFQDILDFRAMDEEFWVRGLGQGGGNWTTVNKEGATERPGSAVRGF